jgi:hypothetical protein
VLSVRGRIAWMAPIPSGLRPRWSLGVSFESLAPAMEQALREYLAGNRLRVGLAFAGQGDDGLLRQALEGHGNLIATDTSEGAQALVTRGNVGALIVCGDDARASALIDWIDTWQAGHQALGADEAPAPAPRLLVNASVDRRKLLG